MRSTVDNVMGTGGAANGCRWIFLAPMSKRSRSFFGTKSPSWSGHRISLLRGQRQPTAVRVIDGYHVAMVVSGSTAYAFTSEMDRQALTRLVADLR